MSPLLLLLIILCYFSILMAISFFASRHVRVTTYFDGDRSSPWILVAFGMIGSGISAVSLVSIPGNVGNNNLYYFQFILGTIVGYLFIACVSAALITWLLNGYFMRAFNFDFGFMNIFVNALLTVIFLLIIRKRGSHA